MLSKGIGLSPKTRWIPYDDSESFKKTRIKTVTQVCSVISTVQIDSIVALCDRAERVDRWDWLIGSSSLEDMVSCSGLLYRL